jgi:hypothetical protein
VNSGKMSVNSGKMTSSDVSSSSDALLSGYLYKRTREGLWQKRWFETSGVYLTYYKSKKMEKLLAALSLPQVGDIRMVSIDDDEENPDKLDGLFALELSTRIYVLRAKSNEDASVWIKTLLRLKQQGTAGGNVNNPMGMLNASITGTVENNQTKEGTGTSSSDKSSSLVGQPDWVKSIRNRMVCC